MSSAVTASSLSLSPREFNNSTHDSQKLISMVIRSLFKIRKKKLTVTPRRKRKKERYIQPVSKRLLPKVAGFQPFDNPWREQAVIEFHPTPQSPWHRTTRPLDVHESPLTSQNHNLLQSESTSSIGTPSDTTIFRTHNTSHDMERLFIPTNLSLSPSAQPQHRKHSAQFQYPSHFVKTTPTRVRLRPSYLPEQAPTSPSVAISTTRWTDSASPSVASLTDAMKAHSLSIGTFPASPPSSPYISTTTKSSVSPSSNQGQWATILPRTRLFDNDTVISSSPSSKQDEEKEIVRWQSSSSSLHFNRKKSTLVASLAEHPVTPAIITPTSWTLSATEGASVHHHTNDVSTSPFFTVPSSSSSSAVTNSATQPELDHGFPPRQLDHVQRHTNTSSSSSSSSSQANVNTNPLPLRNNTGDDEVYSIGSVMEYDDYDSQATEKEDRSVLQQGSMGMVLRNPSTPDQSFSSLSQQSPSSSSSSIPKVTNVSSIARGMVSSSNVHTFLSDR